jgi:histidine triad (HIT) family protein
MDAADCIFCKIVKGQIPCAKLYEDAQVLAFLDIAPVTPGHALVIPKAHYPDLFALPDELGAALLAAKKRVGRALLRAMGATGLNVQQNNAPSAGQVVFHAHYHLIPRRAGDGLLLWPGTPYPDAAALTAVAQAVTAALAEEAGSGR